MARSDRAAWAGPTERSVALDAGVSGRHTCLCGGRDLLLASLANLLHNVFQFTRAGTQFILIAIAAGERFLITARDRCGGLTGGDTDSMLSQLDRCGGGQAGGYLTVDNFPDVGCAFTIDSRCPLAP